MLDTAIVGGGLCGLALARSLHRRGAAFALFEARSRLGGRILTVRGGGSGSGADLGPTWFWPQTQPLLSRLVADLGLADFPQHDAGAVLHLRDPESTPEPLDNRTVHNGARRLRDGMASLVEAIVGELPRDRLHLGHDLAHATDCSDHVVLNFVANDRSVEVKARRVALTFPPRLLAEHVRFEPELDDAMREAMRNAETWMAAQAKVIIGYDRPFWREDGRSGNAFVTHERAVLGEIFDACDENGVIAALGGFLALPPDLRKSFGAGLPMLMTSQMVQVFGTALEQGEQNYQDWSTERYTCSALDREAPGIDHVDVANPMLRRSLWEGRLHFGGAETAAHAAGYLEGALDSARRIDRALGRAAAMTVDADPSSRVNRLFSGNTASLARFSAWVAAQGDAAFDGYRHRLNRSLAAQRRDQLTQIAILESMEAVFAEALKVLDSLTFDLNGVAVERGRSALMPHVQKPFGDLMQSLLDDVVAFNRTSCALSNFPDEHRPSKEYVQTILRDIAAAWQEFSLSANRLLLAKADAQGTKTGVSP